jgi:single-stranded DNA-binding protein
MYNNHTIIGSLVEPPKDNGKCVRLRVCTHSEWRGSRYEVKHFVECWGNSAEIARSFSQGETVLVSGRSQSVKSEYKGETKWFTVIKASEVSTFGGKSAQGTGGGSAGNAYQDSDEVPF